MAGEGWEGKKCPETGGEHSLRKGKDGRRVRWGWREEGRGHVGRFDKKKEMRPWESEKKSHADATPGRWQEPSIPRP